MERASRVFIWVAVASLMVVGGCCGGNQPERTVDSGSEETPLIFAHEFENRWALDKSGMSERYLGRTLRVRGRIVAVDQVTEDGVHLSVAGISDANHIHCFFEGVGRGESAFVVGEQVEFLGRFKGASQADGHLVFDLCKVFGR